MDIQHTAQPAEPTAVDVPRAAASDDGCQAATELPAGYADAEQLAQEMLAAAERGDWPAVTRLRRRIPSLARALHRQWLERRSQDVAGERALEKARTAAIRRVLVVDDQIRALADASDAKVDRWLRGAATTRTLN